MPYVPLAPASRSARGTLSESRWDAIARRSPALAPAVRLQRLLVGRLLDLLDTLEGTGVPRLSLPPRYAAAKLDRALPLLSGEPIPLPVPELTAALLQICQTLASGGAGAVAEHIESALRAQSLDARSLLVASLSRDRHAIHTGAIQHGLSPDLLWLAAELAVSPFAHRLQQATVQPSPDPSLVRALDGWTHGYCPICGSWPALAEVSGGNSVLRCSFCALAWTWPLDRCTYCGQHASLDAHASWPSGAQLQTCARCQGYLKVVECAELTPFPFVAIADLETVDLDVAASERGLGRPELREFSSAGSR